MTVSNQSNRISAVGTGAAQTIPFTFPITANSDLTVIERVTATGDETALNETTNYTVVNNGESGGSITTVTPFVENTSQIHIIRDTPNTQGLDLEQGGAFSAENVEDALDRNTKLTIENVNSLSRTPKFTETDPVTSIGDLPSSEDRISKQAGYDSTGKPNAISAVPEGSVAFSSIGEDIAEAADAAAVRALIGTEQMADIKNLGMVGDGIVDDTTAFVAAIALGVPLFLSDGTYRLTSVIDIPDGTIMKGTSSWGAIASTYRVIFNIDHAGNGFKIVGGGDNIHLSGFRVTKEGLTDEGTGVGIDIDATTGTNSEWRIDNVMCDNLETGIQIEDSIYPYIEKFTAESCTYGMRFTNSSSVTGNHHGMYRDLWFRANTYDIHIEGEFEMNEFDRVKFFNTTTRPIFAPGVGSGTTRTNKFRSLWFEGQDDTGVTGGLIELLLGDSWKFEDIHTGHTAALPLFTSNTDAEITVVRSIDSGDADGDLGVGDLIVSGSHHSNDSLHNIVARVSDSIDTSPKPFTLQARKAMRTEFLGSENIITPAYQSGTKFTNYVTTTRQAFTGWSESNVTKATGQADPYGGTNAVKYTADNATNFFHTGEMTIDGASLADRTFTVQVWAKAVDTDDSNISVRLETSGTDNIGEAIYYIDRDGWFTVWATLTFPSDESEVKIRLFFKIIGNGNEVILFEPCLIESSRPAIFTEAADGVTADTVFERHFGVYSQPTLTETIEISSAEIKDLVGSPKTLVAAQGADTVIEFISAVLIHNAGTAYAEPSAPDDLVIEYATGTDLSESIDATGFLTVTDDEARRVPTTLALTADLIAEKNSAVRLLNTGANYTTGTGTMTVKVTYRIITLGL